MPAPRASGSTAISTSRSSTATSTSSASRSACSPGAGTGPPGGSLKAQILVEGELPLELRLYDPRSELIATGASGEPLHFEADFDDAGSGLEYRLEVEPSPEFDPERTYPYTARLEIPDLEPNESSAKSDPCWGDAVLTPAADAPPGGTPTPSRVATARGLVAAPGKRVRVRISLAHARAM